MALCAAYVLGVFFIILFLFLLFLFLRCNIFHGWLNFANRLFLTVGLNMLLHVVFLFFILCRETLIIKRLVYISFFNYLLLFISDTAWFGNYWFYFDWNMFTYIWNIVFALIIAFFFKFNAFFLYNCIYLWNSCTFLTKPTFRSVLASRS